MYLCDIDNQGCGHTFEIKQRLHDSEKKKCPVCKKWKLYRVIQVPILVGDSTPKTLGQLADRKKNTYEKEHVLNKHQPKTKPGSLREKWEKIQPKPFWRGDKMDKSLGKLTDKQKIKYINTGEKP